MDDRVIELAAKALHANGADNLCNDVLWDNLHQSEADQFRSWARAALTAALTPPERYVLVPVEPTEAMKRAFNGYRPIGRANFACRYEEMLAARPEVKP
ncbi:hypothetical protein ACNPMX_11645 [Stenotrophomonas maltophilia]